ncbi:hypothetical protein [Planobispora longispora]|uniref:hypothetical protein n=1 Tax=Planobispora longispora TaxID=28887 RepID=UPI0019450176|nr:hypothetical protein [Planobispora longispora]
MGTLTRRDRRRFTVAGCAGLVLVAAGLLFWQAGALAPRFSAFSGGFGEELLDDSPERPGTLLVHEERTVVNDGFLPITVAELTASGRGLAPYSVTAQDGRDFPRVLEAGERLPVVVDYAVTDCETATEVIDLRARVERWWGTAEAGVPLVEALPGITGPVTSACGYAEFMAEHRGEPG